MGEGRIIPTLHESGVHGWTWGQVTKRLDFGARKCIGGTANLARREKIKKLQASSSKLQAALTMDHGACRMNIESEENMEVEQLKRIADAIEEILRLVKKDMEPKKK